MIGYSTGSLDRADLRGALAVLSPGEVDAVELSALRTHELGPLLDSIPTLPLTGFSYVSVHAPSAYSPAEEPAIAEALFALTRDAWRVVLHPDTIRDFSLWLPFGDRLCIENMDRRKPGRTVEELEPVFKRLPDASFCFDVAHARHCDTSMTEAYGLLKAFQERLAQVHVSELDAQCRHVRLTTAGIRACQEVAPWIPAGVPAIIEAPVARDAIAAEIKAALLALRRAPEVARAA